MWPERNKRWSRCFQRRSVVPRTEATMHEPEGFWSDLNIQTPVDLLLVQRRNTHAGSACLMSAVLFTTRFIDLSQYFKWSLCKLREITLLLHQGIRHSEAASSTKSSTFLHRFPCMTCVSPFSFPACRSDPRVVMHCRSVGARQMIYPNAKAK